MEDIYEILDELGRNPEKSGEEMKTRQIIRRVMGGLSNYHGKEFGNSLVYSHVGNRADGRLIAVRADFDAVMTDEGSYAHRCGHHGHTAILLDLAMRTNAMEDPGLLLIFQSAEETGAGAVEAIEAGLFEKHKPEMILGFHNLPGYKENQVVIKGGMFNNSVLGFRCSLEGKPSHAASPENGRTPAYAVGRLLNHLEAIKPEQVKISITHAKIGEFQYGTSPGSAVLLGTARSTNDGQIRQFILELGDTLVKLAQEYGLQADLGTSEYFKGIDNTIELADRIKEICAQKGIDFVDMKKLFPAGEDFGFYLEHVEGCFLGVGAGEQHPDLHTKNYFFNRNNLKFTSGLLLDLATGIRR